VLCVAPHKCIDHQMVDCWVRMLREKLKQEVAHLSLEKGGHPEVNGAQKCQLLIRSMQWVVSLVPAGMTLSLSTVATPRTCVMT
jgi:hypothetical protein